MAQHQRKENGDGDSQEIPQFCGDFDELLEVVGPFGRFQWRLTLLMQPPFFFFAFNYLSQIWLVMEPDHWCRNAQLESMGLSQADIKSISTPSVAFLRRQRLSSETEDSLVGCLMYDVNFSHVDPLQWTPSDQTSVVSCRHGWVYNFTQIYPTIVSDNDWVCDQAWKPTLTSSMYFIGSFVGTLFFSHIGDRYGRLPTIVLVHVVCGVAGTVSAFTRSFVLFSATRLLYGTANCQQCVLALILMTEFVGVRYRSAVLNISLAVPYSLGMVMLPWIAKWLGHWQYVAVITSLPMCTALLYLVLKVPESCRWLQHVGRIDEAVAEMRAIATENGRQVPEEVFRTFASAARKKHDDEERSAHTSVLAMLRLPRLRQRTLTLTLATVTMMLSYDLASRYTRFQVDVYAAQSLLGLTELPADLLTLLLVESLGRRWTATLSTLATALSAAAMAVLLRLRLTVIASTAVALLCRFNITIAINAMYQLGMEILPTEVRSRAFGMTQVLGHLTCALSPVILYLERLGRGVPYLILIGVALLGAMAVSFLPETMGRQLPNTLEEGETFGSDQKYFQWFWQTPWHVNKQTKRKVGRVEVPNSAQTSYSLSENSGTA